MPLAALATGVTDERLTVGEIAKRITDLCANAPGRAAGAGTERAGST
jgi:hypothetical protein